VEELAPPDLANNTLLIEQHESVAWQRGMLLPWARSQVSFMKDLVTLRNPRSKFTFINYLHSVGRLDHFINMGNFLPFRSEISAYLGWVADSLESVRVEYGRKVVDVQARLGADGEIASWLVSMADDSTIAAKTIVVGTGRAPHIPEVFRDLPADKIIHSAEYALRASELDPASPLRVAVIGAAQSAAEMLWESHQRLPLADVTMVMRSVGLDYYQTSRFTNELYFPSFTSEFFGSPAEARAHILRDMRRTNYAGVTPEMLDSIYQQMYLERLQGKQRLHMVTMVNVINSKVDGDEVVLTLAHRMGKEVEDLRCDVVMLGTGFELNAPPVVQAIAASAGLDDLNVSRTYRLSLPEGATAGCYLQGTNEATHGISDSLISVLAIRAGEIVEDLVAHRPAPSRLKTVATAA